MTDRPATAAPALSANQQAALNLVLNLIVPPSADGRLPGADEVGVPAFLAAQAPDALPGLRDELDEVERCAQAEFGGGFATLAPADRQALIERLRAQNPAFMSRLALETVTCYYQRDEVLAVLGIETRPPAPQGFQVIQGDLTLLAPVRRRGQVYRDA